MEDIAFNNERQSLCSDCRLLAYLQSGPKPEATDSAQTWSVDESFGSLGRPLCIVFYLVPMVKVQQSAHCLRPGGGGHRHLDVGRTEPRD